MQLLRTAGTSTMGLFSCAFALLGCSSATDPAAAPSALDQKTLIIAPGVSVPLTLDALTTSPAEPTLGQHGYLVVPPSTRLLTAYFDTPVGLGPALEVAGKKPRLVVKPASGPSIEVQGEAGLTTLRFDLTQVALPAATTASLEIFAGESLIGATGSIVVFPIAGDADGDGDFDTADLVQVSQAGKYETGQPAGFSEGDFDGDGVFGSLDLVTALQQGAFEQGPVLAPAKAPKLLALDSKPYYADDFEPQEEGASGGGADDCRIACALIGTEHAPDRAFSVVHKVDPGCWHDDKCAWGAQTNGAGDTEWESCTPPPTASPLQKSLSGWVDGPRYQYTNCGYPENYVAALPSTVGSASTSSSLCQQRANLKLFCDYSRCENSKRTCSFAAKSKLEGQIWASFDRSRYNVTKNVQLENESMSPTTEGRVRVGIPNRAELFEAKLKYSPGEVSSSGVFVVDESGSSTGAQPTDAQCKDFAQAYLDGNVYLDCYLKWGSATTPGWECKLGAKMTLGTKVDLDKLLACLFDGDEGPSGAPIRVALHGNPYDSAVGQTLDLGLSNRNANLGSLYVEAALGTYAGGQMQTVWDDFWKKWNFIGQASTAEGGASVEATAWVEAAGDDPRCVLDAAPFRNQPELEKKIVSSGIISLACAGRGLLAALR